MKKGTFFILLFIFSVLLLSCAKKEYPIYVSPLGSDKNTGSMEKPFATLRQALKLAREKLGSVPVTVYLFGGVYHLKRPLLLTALDSGTKEASLNFVALNSDKTVISGGINISGWKKESGVLWSAELPRDFKGKFRSFYVNNHRAVRARTPDTGFLRVVKSGNDNKTNFFFAKKDFPFVEKVGGMELVLLHDWSITRIGVKSIDWQNNHLLAVDSIGAMRPSFFTITNWEKHPRYFLENALEFCDNQGEWYCDFDERKIYYYPLSDEKMENAECTIPVSEKLIVIRGRKDKHAAFINFKGIIFEHTEWLLPKRGYCATQACMYDERYDKNKNWSQVPAAIELDLADNCGFYDCTVRHTGGSGIWLRENCSNCEISGTHISDIAGNGINIGEGRERTVNGKPWWQSAAEEVSKNNKVYNSLIEDCGIQFFGAVGIWGGLIANTSIDHNEIRNLPYTGVSVGWMWNPRPTPCKENNITSNHIHHVMQILSDGGGIYCLGLQPNSLIRNNLIHDVMINAGRSESNGMFLDEGIKDVLVEKNIIFNIARSPMRFHKAYHNVVRGNVLVCNDDTPPIRYNATKANNIVKIDNLILQQSSKKDRKKLEAIVKQRKNDIGTKERSEWQ